MHDPTALPANLPVPHDDGACLHLRNTFLPDIALPSTGGGTLSVNLAAMTPTVFFFYPRTGVPGQPPSLGFQGEDWDSIPGARGCTPQSCGFRDLAEEFRSLGVSIYGVSTNTTEHQQEFKRRMHVPFDFLSDADLRLTRALRLPTFQFPVESGGPTTLLHRMAWYCDVGTIQHVWYPVFPPDKNAPTVLTWLKNKAAITTTLIAPEHLSFVRDQLTAHWGSTVIWSRGKPFEADKLPGFVAIHDKQPTGLITLALQGDECEIITLSSTHNDAGVGTALMDAAEDQARTRSCRRVFLTTSNDNLRALRFYQRRGWRLVSVLRGMMDTYRSRDKHIPLVGMNQIPLHDEIELELMLKEH